MSNPYTSVDSVAKRYAHRPGCRFVGAEEVGIAVFLMDLRIIVVKSREIPAIDEFLLRSLALSVEQRNHSQSSSGSTSGPSTIGSSSSGGTS